MQIELDNKPTRDRCLASALEQLSASVALTLQQNCAVQEEVHALEERRKHLRSERCTLSEHLKAVLENVQRQTITISDSLRLLEENERLVDEARSLGVEQETISSKLLVLSKLRIDLQNKIAANSERYEKTVAQFKGIELSQNQELENLTREVERIKCQIVTSRELLTKELGSMREHYEKQMAAIGKLYPSGIAGTDTAVIRRRLMTVTKENQAIQEEISILEKQLASSKAEKSVPKSTTKTAADQPRKSRKLFSTKKNKIS